MIQLDVKTAFLYADIEEDVFVERAPDFETKDKKGVRHVHEAGKESVRISSKPPELVEDSGSPSLISFRVSVASYVAFELLSVQPFWLSLSTIL